MSLVADYKQQYAYRAWAQIFDNLPDITGKTILDLGCGIGDQSAELVTRGARVIGLDTNDEFLTAARGRYLKNAKFRNVNLNSAFVLDEQVDGIWCSFVAAYFPNLSEALSRWETHLRDGGWIALIEIDDMFGHEPLLEQSITLLDGYVKDSLHAGRYDFRMGRKLRSFLEDAGFHVTHEFSVQDHELAFDGAASADVLRSWCNRFERMKMLQIHCGAEFESMLDDFLACLARPDHRSLASVRCVVAEKSEQRTRKRAS